MTLAEWRSATHIVVETGKYEDVGILNAYGPFYNEKDADEFALEMNCKDTPGFGNFEVMELTCSPSSSHTPPQSCVRRSSPSATVQQNDMEASHEPRPDDATARGDRGATDNRQGDYGH